MPGISYKYMRHMSNHNGHSHNGNGGWPPGGGPEDRDDNSRDNIVRLPGPAERLRAAREQARLQRPAAEPLINLPPVTKFLILAFLAVHIVTNFFMDDIARYDVFTHFGLVTGAYTGHAPAPLWAKIVGPFTYAFLHGSWPHLLMNGFMMMAFGAGVERWLGGRRLLALFMLCSLASALVQFGFTPEATDPVIGASGGLSGLFAAVLMMMQQRGLGNAGRYGIWPFVFLWIGLSVLFGMMGGPDGSLIAWPAHIGGFLAGFLFLKPVMRWF